MLRFEFKLGRYALSTDSSPYDLGDMIVTGRLGQADSRQSPGEFMMIYMSIGVLINFLEILVDSKGDVVADFDGIDGAFKLDLVRRGEVVSVVYRIRV